MLIHRRQCIHVIGDGMVGLLAAVAFSSAGFEVFLFGDDAILQKKTSKTDDRTSAITPVSVKILQSLGVWGKIPEDQLSPFFEINVWENQPEQQKPLIFKTFQQTSPLGYMVSNAVLQTALKEKLQNIQKNFYSINSHLALDNPSLTIVADGAMSSTRQKIGITCKIKDYYQSAVTTVIKTACPHEKIARQCFLPAGPLAFLPLKNQQHCAIVWSERPEQAKILATCPPEVFNTALQQAFGSILGEVSVIGPRSVFPLKMQQAKSYIKPAFALVGDVAHTVHPLAGHGVNMGFLDVMALLKTVQYAKSKHQPIGSLSVLRRYERQRKTENLFMSSIIHGFTCNLLRKPAMYITQRSEGLRKFFTYFMSCEGIDNLF